MVKFRIPYVHHFEGSFTALQLYNSICTQAGVVAGNLSFTNSDFVIQGNAYTNNETCEDVLKDLAKLAGGFAKIGRDNKCYIKNIQVEGNVDDTISKQDYFEDFELGTEYIELNRLTIGLSAVTGEENVREDAESIEEYGIIQMDIDDIAFLTNSEEREVIIDDVWDELKRLTYKSTGEYKYKGFPYLDSGDIIGLYDKNNTLYYSYVFNHKFIYNGSYSGTISAPIIDNTADISVHNFSNDAKKTFKKVELAVDKINGEISAIIENEEETSNKIVSMGITMDNIQTNVENTVRSTDESISSITNRVKTLEDSNEYNISVIEEIQENGVDKIITSTGFTFDEDGLTIEKTSAKTKTLVDEKGLAIEDTTGSTGENLLFAGYDEETGETIVKSKNMTVEKYLTIGTKSRIEDFENGTGVFWIGG